MGTFEGPGSGVDAVNWEKELSRAAKYLSCGRSLPAGCEAFSGQGVGGVAKPCPLPRACSAALKLKSAGRALSDPCMCCPPLSGTRIPLFSTPIMDSLLLPRKIALVLQSRVLRNQANLLKGVLNKSYQKTHLA